MKFNIADTVKSKTNGRIGIIVKKHKTCPQSNSWIQNQIVPILAQSIRRPWYSIRVLPFGGIVCPAYDLELIMINTLN